MRRRTHNDYRTDSPVVGLRVLDLRDSPWVDGPGRTILQSAAKMDQTKCQIIIGAFCGKSHDKHAYMQEAYRLNLPVHPIVEENVFDYKVFTQILDIIKSESIDVLHTHDFRSNIFGLLCATISGIPVMTTCHGWIANNWKGRIYTAIDKFMLRFFDRVLAVSDTMGQQLRKLGVKSGRIRVIHNALIVDHYTPDRSTRVFRQQLDVPDDTHIITNIGRLSLEKGQDVFLKAAEILLRDNQNLLFVLVGIGPEEERLRVLAKELGIEKHLIFAGYRSDMQDIYNSVDLVVQTSFTEGMPNVILESLLMEVPVVATDVGGTAEVIQDRKTGWLIDPYDTGQLVAGIMDYITNADWHRLAAKEGRLYVKENFDHQKRVALLAETYQGLSLTRAME